MLTSYKGYKGRFAPSPSGPLHLGSLACALASYLDAKVHHGQWFIRIEDIDPPREPQGAAKNIIQCLNAHHLHADGPLLYQSTRSQAYHAAINQLQKQGLTYYCQCTRKTLLALNHCYNGHCRNLEHTSGALRLNLQKAQSLGFNLTIHFSDHLCGPQTQHLEHTGDFIIHRKDGLFAYQLAVVVDDIFQGITHVIRGDDLLNMTACQQLLFSLLKAPIPEYGHIPVLLDEQGHKLSKQNGAPELDITQPLNNLKNALNALGLPCPNSVNAPQPLLRWATEAWASAHT